MASTSTSHQRRVSFPASLGPSDAPKLVVHAPRTPEKDRAAAEVDRQRTRSLGAPVSLAAMQATANQDPTTLAARDVLVLATAFKLLLYPAYRSTDFEVHRNWLAITHSLPLSKWYYDTTSEWTLDYPPFFAWFEYLLSWPARLVDPAIVDLQNLRYDAWSVIAYQRTTVIITELVLGAALLRFVRGAPNPSVQRILSASLFLHPGFLIVDHIHFQYNGFMFGIMAWSLLMARNGNPLGSGILFAVLLNFKHIYMYLAPAYFVYLLRAYCMTPSGTPRIPQFIALASSVLGVFALSFAPFALHLPQLLSRLFPFTRGLNHAYWAPNAWALVTFLDRVLLKLGFAVNDDTGVRSASRGLVGDTVFAVVPNIKPLHTFVITLAFQMVFLAKLWRDPTYKSFLRALTLCGYTSYMFGWHVHEKAVLLVLVPLTLLAAEDHAHFRTFALASLSGIYSLFPLLFTPAEAALELAYSLLWMILVFSALAKVTYTFPRTPLAVALDFLERAYMWGFIGLQAFVWVFPLTRKGGEFDFVPLMATSVYCAVGLVWAYVRLGAMYVLGIGAAGEHEKSE
ncbi:glycosyltransferase family 57 protein [Exidia glandulosa HHB12029]|uniref:Alpha-1,3-glucosyltransferase n=1 Tax=Exidia glandulosa HHB12029 TaxID=1314781 RepID=A0A165QJP6_EXIGL|nr:glycosyltransferase family 57 protein [Exidia glandulosa HHB12029]